MDFLSYYFLYIYRSIYLSIYLFAYLSIYLSIYLIRKHPFGADVDDLEVMPSNEAVVEETDMENLTAKFHFVDLGEYPSLSFFVSMSIYPSI